MTLPKTWDELKEGDEVIVRGMGLRHDTNLNIGIAKVIGFTKTLIKTDFGSFNRNSKREYGHSSAYHSAQIELPKSEEKLENIKQHIRVARLRQKLRRVYEDNWKKLTEEQLIKILEIIG